MCRHDPLRHIAQKVELVPELDAVPVADPDVPDHLLLPLGLVAVGAPRDLKDTGPGTGSPPPPAPRTSGGGPPPGTSGTRAREPAAPPGEPRMRPPRERLTSRGPPRRRRD